MKIVKDKGLCGHDVVVVEIIFESRQMGEWGEQSYQEFLLLL